MNNDLPSEIAVGDTVLCRPCFGGGAPVRAVILTMEKTRFPRQKYGEDVERAPWSAKDYLVVTLDSGHWAYGEQLAPIAEEPDTAVKLDDFYGPAGGYIERYDFGGAFDGFEVSSDADGGL